jgi:hypothetical protein
LVGSAVYVRGFAFGHHGGRKTEVWIRKPAMAYREKTGFDTSRKEMVTDLDLEVVDLLLGFAERPPW